MVKDPTKGDDDDSLAPAKQKKKKKSDEEKLGTYVFHKKQLHKNT